MNVKYNFNEVITRRNTNSVKWDRKTDDVLPMWVADMDFRAADPIVEAIQKRAAHGVYGYSFPSESYYNAMVEWWKKRHGWQINRSWITFSPGVVPAVNMLIKAFTQPGDKIIMQTPVYYPFFNAAQNNGCQVVENPLILNDGKYEMDYDDLETKVKDPRTTVLILCSPHNPVGRVWRREELERLGNLCIEHGVIIISDEIHCDLVYKEYEHIPFGAISEDFASHSVICTAPSKTFNLAGLHTSSVIIRNNELRRQYKNVLESNGLGGPNIFGMEATEAAYLHGEDWLEQLLDYLKDNLNFLKQHVGKNIPKIKVIEPEGTYLVWLDCRDLGMDAVELHEFMLNNAKVWFDEGYIFGQGGEGFERINIGCPRTYLEEGLRRMEKAINNL